MLNGRVGEIMEDIRSYGEEPKRDREDPQVERREAARNDDEVPFEIPRD